MAAITRNNRRQKTEFRSQKKFDVVSLHPLEKIECAEGANRILNPGFLRDDYGEAYYL